MLKFSFREQILIGFAVTFLLVAGISYYSYKCIINLEEDGFKVEHTQKVIDATDELLKNLLNAETGQRGYVITGDTKFLEPYNSSIGKVRLMIDSLSKVMVDNPSQQKNIDSLYYFADKKLHFMSDVISLYQTNGFDTVQSIVNTGTGKLYMDRLRFFIDRVVTLENRLLNERKIRTTQSIYSSIQAISIGAILFAAVTSVLWYVIRRFFERQTHYQGQIKRSNSELEKVLNANEEKNWVLTGLRKVNEAIQSRQTEIQMAAHLIQIVGDYTRASFGTFYLFSEEEQQLNFVASYGISDWENVRKTLPASEKWMGFTLAEGQLVELEGPPNEKLKFETTILAAEIYKSFIVPFYFHAQLMGVIEIAFHEPSEKIKDLLSEISLISGESLHRARSRTIRQQLFEQTQQQAEELEAQQEELRTTNEELIYKTEMLQASEEELRVQQVELKEANAELVSKAKELAERNEAIEIARAQIVQKMQELETSGRYKSEFLANMSHELRTPLNSILVLAQILKDNQKQNLSTDQVKYADVILRAGTDLLTLINDILDLTKIESGKIDLEIDDVDLNIVISNMENLFLEIASKKSIRFNKIIGEGVSVIRTDLLRLEQILKNLLSNAFKFTNKGGEIDLSFQKKDTWLEISVKDNGIGIAEDKQGLVFEAFQQADGSTSRKYGGTGLGLSISRELAIFLGGKISITSAVGKGSTFTLSLPLEPIIPDEKTVPPTAPKNTPQKEVQPGRLFSEPVAAINDKPLLMIVEDDIQFADILSNHAQEYGYRTSLLHEGTYVAEKARELKPRAIVLDIMLPGKDGWQILRELKKDESLAGIPVHMMSAGDVVGKKVRQAGAVGFLKKPVTKETLDTLFVQQIPAADFTSEKILLVENQIENGSDLQQVFAEKNLLTEKAISGHEAIKKLENENYGCVILDPDLPDMSGFDLLDRIKSDERYANVPVIITTAMELDKDMQKRLAQYADATILKTGKYSERLIDEVNVFLNKLNKPTQKLVGLNGFYLQSGPIIPAIGREKLKNKKILLVDDDMRNIFALSSALHVHELQIDIAADGNEAIEKVQQNEYDVVLMDMMMPVMDGYEAMRNIRANQHFASLPIIALTAKAMKDDRVKCMEAGASDYLTKPVDTEILLNLLQIWIK